jgi:hypothetical protein
MPPDALDNARRSVEEVFLLENKEALTVAT